MVIIRLTKVEKDLTLCLNLIKKMNNIHLYNKIKMNSLFVAPYNDTSFIVLGETLQNSENLIKLGGKITLTKFGFQWLFSNVHQASVEAYIKNGIVEPYKYTKEDHEKFKQLRNERANKVEQSKNAEKLFIELEYAFDKKLDYDGKSVIDVINALKERYILSEHDGLNETFKLLLNAFEADNDYSGREVLKALTLIKQYTTKDMRKPLKKSRGKTTSTISSIKP